ncbi:MAG: glycyl radical protein [Deltaproteobacteria bacterium]|nr:glycyl radical protein [Deltaproteobacteria bacterium]
MTAVSVETPAAPAQIFAFPAKRPNSYDLDWSSAERRLKEIKDFLLAAPQTMDPERLKFLLEVYEERQGEAPVIVRARLLERVLTKKTIFLDDNPVVGALTGVRAGVYAYPEWSADWIKDEIDLAKMGSLGEIKISAETQDLLKQVYAKWKGRTVFDQANRGYQELYGEDPKRLFKAGALFEGPAYTTGTGAVDYRRAIHEGLGSIIDEIDRRVAALPKRAGASAALAFYRAAKISLSAAVAHANRYADLAAQEARRAPTPARQAELLEIAEVCRRVPEHPARNFREAVQSFWFVHLVQEIEQMGCAVSPGRYGQYMQPFYEKDLAEGRLTREEAVTLLSFQWLKHSELAIYQGLSNALALSGHTGQTITIGGLTAEGEDASTELEEVLMDVQIRLRNIQPTLSLFYHPKMKESYLLKAVEVVRGGSGQPQWLNNRLAVERALSRFSDSGITIGQARNCGNFGCVATGVLDEGCYFAVGATLNLAKFVELTLNDGLDPLTKKRLGPQTGPAAQFQSFEELYEAFLVQLDHGARQQRRYSNLGCLAKEATVPGPYRSSLYGGCLEKGLPEEAGGARFSQALDIVAGGVDAANSLLAVRSLVFEQGLTTMAELLAALQANFEGFEALRRQCLAAPKHGNDDPTADALVKRLYRDVDRLYTAHGPDYLGRAPRVDAFSLSYHNLFGGLMGALPNGRQSGRALTDGSVSATPGTDVQGVTALIKSAAGAVDTVRYNSNHFNVKFLPQALEGPKGARTLLALIKTYFDLGGSHIQFNCVDSDVLKEAQTKPDDHKNLVVRVAGFSAYFTRLDHGVQDEIIKRTQYN